MHKPKTALKEIFFCYDVTIMSPLMFGSANGIAEVAGGWQSKLVVICDVCLCEM